MPNHFHLLVKQTEENGISKFMAKFTNSYTKYFNTRYQRIGPLVQGVFKAVHVETDEQFIHLSRYIHLNPITGFLVKPDELQAYPWSSYPNYLENPNDDQKEIMNFFKSSNKYKEFVLAQIDHAKKLKEIEYLTID